MADKKDKPTADEVVEESKAEEVVAEEPKAEGPTDAPAGEVASAGTDQYGRQLYSVTCASCGKQAQVPFKPSGDRPVYCRDCYMQQRKGGAGRGRDRGPRR